MIQRRVQNRIAVITYKVGVSYLINHTFFHRPGFLEPCATHLLLLNHVFVESCVPLIFRF